MTGKDETSPRKHPMVMETGIYHAAKPKLITLVTEWFITSTFYMTEDPHKVHDSRDKPCS